MVVSSSLLHDANTASITADHSNFFIFTFMAAKIEIDYKLILNIMIIVF